MSTSTPTASRNTIARQIQSGGACQLNADLLSVIEFSVQPPGCPPCSGHSVAQAEGSRRLCPESPSRVLEASALVLYASEREVLMQETYHAVVLCRLVWLPAWLRALEKGPSDQSTRAIHFTCVLLRSRYWAGTIRTRAKRWAQVQAVLPE